MSEFNGHSESPRRHKRKDLSHQEFFKLCEELRNQREQVLSKCHTLPETAKFMEERLGFLPSDHATSNALEAVGIVLEKIRGSHSGAKAQNTRVLGVSLLKLYRKLGEEPPAELLKLVEIQEGKSQPELSLAARKPDPGIPVAAVPDPQTISVVGKGHPNRVR